MNKIYKNEIMVFVLGIFCTVGASLLGAPKKEGLVPVVFEPALVQPTHLSPLQQPTTQSLSQPKRKRSCKSIAVLRKKPVTNSRRKRAIPLVRRTHSNQRSGKVSTACSRRRLKTASVQTSTLRRVSHGSKSVRAQRKNRHPLPSKLHTPVRGRVTLQSSKRVNASASLTPHSRAAVKAHHPLVGKVYQISQNPLETTNRIAPVKDNQNATIVKDTLRQPLTTAHSSKNSL
ncbi:hypothetical protein H0W26_04510, partial [Candidatus Dependentiae bacterium]|nr:hypothetical protein [Candidatus Dependentiae bacterium]